MGNQCCTKNLWIAQKSWMTFCYLSSSSPRYLKFKFVSTSSAGSEEEDFEGFEEDEFDYLSS